jgi:hypothetical protein
MWFPNEGFFYLTATPQLSAGVSFEDESDKYSLPEEIDDDRGSEQSKKYWYQCPY